MILRTVNWVEMLGPVEDGGMRYCVGRKHDFTMPESLITRITIQADVPGLHGDMWRAVVWAGDDVVAEIPYLNLAGVGRTIEDFQSA
jgi:hypothetical protein